jgi:hypothetical protein
VYNGGSVGGLKWPSVIGINSTTSGTYRSELIGWGEWLCVNARLNLFTKLPLLIKPFIGIGPRGNSESRSEVSGGPGCHSSTTASPDFLSFSLSNEVMVSAKLWENPAD